LHQVSVYKNNFFSGPFYYDFISIAETVE